MNRRAPGFGVVLGILGFITAVSGVARAQEEPAPENRFVLAGYGFVDYVDSDAADAPETFDASFSPILLYSVGEDFLFESELEFGFEDDQLETEVEYAQIDWFAHDNLTLVAGKFLTPFGSFIETIHPAWINKLPTFPLPYQHGQSLVPFSQTGLQVRGAFPLGDGYRRFTYSVFVSNGFQQSEHEHGEEGGEEPEEPGAHEEEGEHEEFEPIFLDGSSFNGNGDTAFGGRLSCFPARGLEIGASYLSGSYDEEGVLDSTLYGVYLSYHQDLFDVRGEWIDSETQLGFADDGDPLGDQTVDSWYIQPSLRLSVIPAYFFNRLEAVARYASLDFTEIKQEQTSIGLNYYFNGSTIFKLAWERLEETGGESNDSVHAMLAIGF